MLSAIAEGATLEVLAFLAVVGLVSTHQLSVYDAAYLELARRGQPLGMSKGPESFRRRSDASREGWA